MDNNKVNNLIIRCVIVMCLLCLISFVVNESGSGSSSEYSKRKTAERYVKSQLNYPSSYSLQGWAVNGNQVTLEYKAKNAFGMEKTQRTTITVK